MSGKRSARQRRVSLQQPAVLQMAESLEVRRLLTAAGDEICAEPLLLEKGPADDYPVDQPGMDTPGDFETGLEYRPQVISCELPEDFWRCGLPMPEIPVEPEIELEYVTCEIPDETSAELTLESAVVDETNAVLEGFEWFEEVSEERPVDAGLSGDDRNEADFGEYLVCGWPDESFTDFAGSVSEEFYWSDDKMSWSGDVDSAFDPEQLEGLSQGFAELTIDEPSGEEFFEDWPVFEEWNDPLILSDDSLLLMNSDLQPFPVMMLRTFALAPAVESSAAAIAAEVADVSIRQHSPESVFAQRAVASTALSDRSIDARLVAVRSEARPAVPGAAVLRRPVPAASTTFGPRQTIAELLPTEISRELSELDVLPEPVRRQQPRPEPPVNTEQPPIAPVSDDSSVIRTQKPMSDTVATNTQDTAVAELFVQGLPPQ